MRGVALSGEEQISLSRRLSFLLTAGIPLLSSLEIISSTFSTKKADNFNIVISHVTKGLTLSASMRLTPGFVGEQFIHFLSVGEKSGTLAHSLLYLSDQLYKQKIVKKKLQSALMYPVCVAVITAGITGFLVFFIVPKIVPVFSSMKLSLPVSTRLLILFSYAIRNHYVLIVSGCCAVVGVFRFLIRTYPKNRRRFEYVLLTLPMIQWVIRAYILTTIFRSVATLSKAGVYMHDALSITSVSTNFITYREELEYFATYVRQGKGISSHMMKKKKLFPPIISNMLAVAETAGNLSDTCAYVAELYETEFDEHVRSFSNLLEPLLMVTMGLVVGFITLSIILPIYEVTQHVAA